MRIWCPNHKRITNAYPTTYGYKYPDKRSMKAKCGCYFTHKKWKELKIIQRNHYFLPDGREIVRIPMMLQTPKWLPKDTIKKKAK